MSCVVCSYSGNNRSFRNVGTSEYPDDMICNLCDTEGYGNGSSRAAREVAEARRASGLDESGQDSFGLPLALRGDGEEWWPGAYESPYGLQG